MNVYEPGEYWKLCRAVCGKCVFYAGIRILNSLPHSLSSLMNDKANFKVELKKYLNTNSFYSVNEFFYV